MPDRTWDQFFKKRGRYYLVPHPDLPKVISKFRTFRVKKVLDLGSGSGRHSIALAKARFDVTGMDFSKEALQLAKKWAKLENLKLTLKKGDFHEKLPFNKDAYDAVIAISCLQYHSKEALKFTLLEINRILKKRGLLFLTLPLETGTPDMTHLVFTKKEIDEIIQDHFKPLNHFIDKQKHYCIFGMKT